MFNKIQSNEQEKERERERKKIILRKPKRYDYNNVNVNSAKYLIQYRNPIDLDEELIEIADVDQVKFERLKCLYKQNADCLLSKNESEHDTQVLLTEFLNMLNNWKWRKFNEKSIEVLVIQYKKCKNLIFFNIFQIKFQIKIVFQILFY